ncbi:MAG: RecQ family zinc-binding domain-containing protein, partial [Deltaproteobacteria bacterium]|nr:RecQ family zinc-binding domain-containing protein [Deltaproteobacteria bacterium]
RVITALNYLEEQGDLKLQVAQARLGYRQLKKLSEDEQGQLKEECVARFSKREENDIKRLRLIVDMVNCNGCKTTFLLNYFGEENLSDCGHCEFCLNGLCDQIIPAASGLQELKGEVKNRALSLAAEYPEALSLPRQQARFFCGISSPRLIRAKLLQNPSFGMASHVSFATVMSALS